MKNIAIIGTQGAIGRAFVEALSTLYPDALIHAFSRSPQQDNHCLNLNVQNHLIDYDTETSLEEAVKLATTDNLLDMVIVATGILHDTDINPEKSLRDITAEKMSHLFYINTIIPALVAKHFIPKLHKTKRVIFAALSARVGSISDNHLGGWYSYRASKAALNMIIKNVAIETGRYNTQAIIVGLHPGTVDSPLSKPFQTHVADGKLFTAEFSVAKMLSVLDALEPKQTGLCFAWDGTQIMP
jgi:NAD(P)-dependent dehydrogenase (short-subunit alcohol dehydrogenase family)